MDKEILINEKYDLLWSGKTRYYFINGGRGSSKSFPVSLFLENLTWEIGHTILFTRYTLTTTGISIIPEFKEKIELHSDSKYFKFTEKEIINKLTDSLILFRGIKTSSGNQTANLKSIHGVTTWVLDEAEELQDEDIFDKIDESIRLLGVDLRIIVVFNGSFKKHFIHKRFYSDRNLPYNFTGIYEDSTYIYTNYLENLENLAPSFIAKAEKLKENNLAKYKHRYLGEPLDEVNGALWTDSLFKHVNELPELKKICIALDPSITGTDESDECGIICMGLGFDNFIYIFRDETAIYTPLKWANKAVYLHEILKANCIVAEVNQGGDMVKTIIQQIENRIMVETVWSKQGKVLRAEPIVALYEQGIVKHLTGLSKLEYEMTTWTPDEGYSPGRIDALVHGINYLYEANKTPNYSYS